MAFEELVGFKISSQEQLLPALQAPPAPRYPNLARLIDWTITGDKRYLIDIPYKSPEPFSPTETRLNNWVIPWLRRDLTTPRAAEGENHLKQRMLSSHVRLSLMQPPHIGQGQTTSQLQTVDNER